MTLTCRHVILFLSLQIRRHHLEFNEHLHSCFGDQRFVQAHSTENFCTFDSSHFRKPVGLAGEGRTGLLCCFQILYLQGGASLLWLVYPEIQERCARTFLAPFFGIFLEGHERPCQLQLKSFPRWPFSCPQHHGQGWWSCTTFDAVLLLRCVSWASVQCHIVLGRARKITVVYFDMCTSTTQRPANQCIIWLVCWSSFRESEWPKKNRLDSVRISGWYKWAEGWHPRGFVGFEKKHLLESSFPRCCSSRWSRNARVIWLLARPWFPPKRSRQMTGKPPWSVRWMVWNGRREYTWCLGQYHVMMSAKDETLL